MRSPFRRGLAGVHPVAELRSFLRAALVTPVPPVPCDPPDPGPGRAASLPRRRSVAAVTVLVGSLLLWWTVRLAPGDPLFYVGSGALAATWLVGAFLAGPLSLGRAHTRAGTAYARPVVQSVALGTVLLVVFLVGALLVAQVPVLRGPVDDLLDHARSGTLGLVLVVTAVNGVAEEVFFRGALYDAVPARWAVGATTVLYALTTVVAGVPLLVLAALSLGLVCGLQRRVTGGVLGPVVTHVTWSAGMLLLLPPLLSLLEVTP